MKREFLRLTALSILLAGLWCVVYGRTTGPSWQVPVQYSGDALSLLAYLKAARDGHVRPVVPTAVPELNAPYDANWNDYPRPQKAFFWLAGRVARAAGLFLTANLLLLLAHVLAGVGFYGVARYLRSRPLWAAAGAIAFAASHFIWYRSLNHLALSLYWHVPPAALVSAWCFRRRGLSVASRRFGFALLVAAIAALFNVYYSALFVQFLLLSAVAQAARGNWRRAAAPILLSATVVGLFALESLGTLLYPSRHGSNPAAVVRSYGDLETYALKPIELALPPPASGLLGYGRLASGYWDNARGEIGSAYLGLAALAGVALLVRRPLAAFVRGRPVFVSQAIAASLWIGVFSVAGGINGVLGSFGVVLLRGTNRYSIWLAAIALLHLTWRLSRIRLPRRAAALLASLFVGFVLLDQLPARAAAGDVDRLRAELEADRAFALKIESALPARPMVFMLPVLDFPEGGEIREMPDYEHLRPYLFTSRVRYSYGTDKGRPREDWQRRVASMNPAKMVERLEAYGFSGVWIDRRAFADAGLTLLSGLAEAGRPVTIDDPDRRRAFVRLRPQGVTRLPDSAPILGPGWYGRPQPAGFWARGSRAEWIVSNPLAAPQAVALDFELTVAKPRTVSLTQDGRILASWRPDPAVSVVGLRLVLPPGESRLVLTTDRAPDLVEVGNRLRFATFAVQDLELREE